MSSADVESLEPRARPRSRCLDVCLVGSVTTLFALVLGGAGAALMFVKDLPDVAESQRSHGQMPSGLLSYQMQNFAYMRATSQIVTDVMKWEPVKYGNGTTMGSRYSYNTNQEALTVSQQGSYFLYTQLRFTCVHKCNSTTLTVTFQDQFAVKHLSCTVKLPENFEPVMNKCWTVIPAPEGGQQDPGQSFRAVQHGTTGNST
ncbi:uncharacterized protein LOC113582858 [Electrophorus electricus]|uniref:uncharacterized protein LOC113582858 n=1 Tax=Electrophorus electricus TaxID=8005 RepID=UPI0015D07694|nr:uncharacterized protein LOC113582858 [Electrophorus electricus]